MDSGDEMDRYDGGEQLHWRDRAAIRANRNSALARAAAAIVYVARHGYNNAHRQRTVARMRAKLIRNVERVDCNACVR